MRQYHAGGRDVPNLMQTATDWRRQYELLLNSLPDAVLVCDAAGTLLACNDAAARLSGYPREELLKLPLRKILEFETSPENSAAIPGEMIHRDGSRIPVEIYRSSQQEGAWPAAHQYLLRHIRAHGPDEETRRHENHFRLMAKNLTEMVLAYDMDRRLTFANGAAETLTGYSAADLEQARFICWIHPDDRERMLGHWDKLFQGRSFYEEQYRLITRDGRMKWVAASWGPILDDSGQQVGVQGRERDITSRRMAEETLLQSEQRLRISEERYRTIFESSAFPMWEEDFSGVKIFLDSLRAQGVTNLRAYLTENRPAAEECLRRVKILDVNRAAREFYGAQDKSELVGDLTRMFDEPAYENFIEEIAVLYETGSAFQAELPVRTIRGEIRNVHMMVSIAPTPQLDWSRVVVSFFDITDRRRLEDQLLQSQKLESLGRLAGGIAHDFNNLLTVINGYSDMLLRRLPPGDSTRTYVGEIHTAGQRGAELTQQLLAFSRKQVAQLRPLDLNELVRESQTMLERVIGEDVRLVIRLDPEIGIVKADRGQLHQVLMNLVVNGREAMPHGGTLTIETRNVYLGTELEERPAGPGTQPYVLLRIRDTGIGMDEETRQHVFEPFFTTKHSKGTGLGLSTVFGVVMQSGGHITVSSELGRGSTFDVLLPKTQATSRTEAPAAVQGQPGKGSGVVMVVEDQPEVRALTCMILRGQGFEVLEASDGLEALLMAGQYRSPIRLLVTDMIMPGMNGKEVAARLTMQYPEIRVIFMSGYTDQMMTGSSLLEHSAAFLQKPFTPDRLLSLVQKVLG
jgi:PAS domain S-box-containing protein